jgi:hypothetical protein
MVLNLIPLATWPVTFGAGRSTLEAGLCSLVCQCAVFATVCLYGDCRHSAPCKVHDGAFGSLELRQLQSVQMAYIICS